MPSGRSIGAGTISLKHVRAVLGEAPRHSRDHVVAIGAGIGGMGLGIGMGMSQDFRLAPADAYLNLLGWVSMFLYGLFYRCVPEAAQGPLPRVQSWLATIGLALMVPGLALILLGSDAAEPAVGLAGALTLASLLVFAAVVLRGMRDPLSRRPAELRTAARG